MLAFSASLFAVITPGGETVQNKHLLEPTNVAKLFERSHYHKENTETERDIKKKNSKASLLYFETS